ncbi:hypothetical protein [uncultured Chloroflexus sp.]|uniref:hypothetical protein n=1 Tax=uncultured Chloroflexus sp. TaxID=214040 RepID=UPI002612CECE|nr:hypothetical protein [uncultured Chloroflexus sp.]
MAAQSSAGQPSRSPAAQQAPASKRRGLSGCFLWLFVITMLAISLIGLGFLQPVKLAIAQEFIIGVTRGGIRETIEATSVDSCIRVAGRDQLQSITRTRRVTTYNNGSVLELVFSDPPLPADCR